jgi:hypothetical protein
MQYESHRALGEGAAGDIRATYAKPLAVPRLLYLSATVYLACSLASCGSANQQSGVSTGSTSSASTTGAAASGGTDYSIVAHWVCRPGEESICTTGLDAIVEKADGSTAAQAFTPAVDPPIDCFYIYPTVSLEKTQYADLTDSPEIQAETKAQVGRLSSRCRIFAPIYRQETEYGLNQAASGTPATQSDVPTLDVQAAWNYYLENDNQGRGVVLIGHSQGTILLQNLIAESIDGTASQALLVSAFLAGNPSLGVPPGGVVGGTFAHIPTCSAAAQTGCVYVWASYLAGDTSAPPVFGRARGDGLVSACVSPAAPAGASAMLKFYHQNTQPPWFVEALGQVSGECQAGSSGANIFVVTVEPGQFADTDTAILKAVEVAPGWGVHPDDIALVQGNMLDVLDAEIATWQSQH